MANKLYKEEAVKEIAEAIRIKLATPNGEKSTLGDKYLISEMAAAIDDIPVRMGFPSTSRTTISIPTGGYTATANGWIYYAANTRGTAYTWRYIRLDNTTTGMYCYCCDRGSSQQTQYAANAGSSWSYRTRYTGCNPNEYLIVPVRKGDVVKLTMGHGSGSTSGTAYFVSEHESDRRNKLKP